MGMMQSRATVSGGEAVQKLIAEYIQNNKVMVFSKSYCPFCTKAKQALNQVISRDQYTVLEIENRSDVGEMQDILLQMTGGRTVPRVFINGQCIGGGDETAMMLRNGQLQTKLKEAGVLQ